jgi:hypothetical protein
MSSVRIALMAGPPALLALAATAWLWLRYGMGVYLDAALGAFAGCF